MPRDKLVGFQASEEEKREIQNHANDAGFTSVSAYLRFCEADFNARRFNASKQKEISTIEDCIKLLEGHKKGVQDTLIQQSLKDLEENLKGDSEKKSESFKENSENLKANLKGLDEQTLKETRQNLKGPVERGIEKNPKLFKKVFDTLIRLTKVKGRIPDDDFTYQAKRCGVKKQYLVEYYDNNYSYFVEEAEKYHP